LNTVRLGGANPSRLLVPVLPGSDLSVALGGPPMSSAASRIRVGVRPRRLRAGSRRVVRITLRSSDPQCLRRATIRVAGRRLRTDSRGRARVHLRVRKRGRRIVRASHVGCLGGRALLRVRR
jgi:hypothetical protein